MAIESRRIIKMGVSRVVTLPRWWLRDVGRGIDRVSIVGDKILVVMPVGQEEIARRVVDSIQMEMAASMLVKA